MKVTEHRNDRNHCIDSTCESPVVAMMQCRGCWNKGIDLPNSTVYVCQKHMIAWSYNLSLKPGDVYHLGCDTEVPFHEWLSWWVLLENA